MEGDVASSTASVGAFNIEDYIISENTEKDSRKFGSVYKSSHYIIEPAPQSVIEFNYVIRHKFLPDFLESNKGRKVAMLVNPISEKLDIVEGGKAKITQADYIMRTPAMVSSGLDTLEEIITILESRNESAACAGSGWSVRY